MEPSVSGRVPRARRRRRTVVVLLLLVLAALVVVVPRIREGGGPPPHPVHFLVGAALPDNADPSPMERAAGVHLGIHRTFWDRSGLDASVEVARQDLARGRVPLLSYKTGDWGGASRGADDDWVRSAARRLSALGGTVMVALDHEPEGDGDIRLWTRLQQRLAPFFDLPHLEFGVVLTGYHQFFGDPEYSLPSLWPTGAPIDFLGLDIYQSYGSVSKQTGALRTRWTNLDHTYFSRVREFCASKGIFWGLAETGITDRAWAERPEAPRWFASTASAIAREGGTFFAYFDSRQNSGANTWPLSGSKRAAFLDLLRSPPTSSAG
ncbi:MAG: hypothetical protein ABI776_07105 [Nocardioidaceae bacterium]